MWTMQERWQRLVENYQQFRKEAEFFVGTSEHGEAILRDALSGPTPNFFETVIILSAANELASSAAFAFIDDLVYLSQSQKFATPAWEIICRLPKELVIARVEEQLPSLMHGADYISAMLLLTLCHRLSKSLYEKCLHMALESEDPDIRELAADWKQNPRDGNMQDMNDGNNSDRIS